MKRKAEYIPASFFFLFFFVKSNEGKSFLPHRNRTFSLRSKLYSLIKTIVLQSLEKLHVKIKVHARLPHSP